MKGGKGRGVGKSERPVGRFKGKSRAQEMGELFVEGFDLGGVTEKTDN